MKIKEGFHKREVCGEHIVIPDSISRINFNKMMVLNSSASFLWDNLEGKEFSVEDVGKLLFDNYDISREKADEDAQAIVDQWKESGLVI